MNGWVAQTACVTSWIDDRCSPESGREDSYFLFPAQFVLFAIVLFLGPRVTPLLFCLYNFPFASRMKPGE